MQISAAGFQLQSFQPQMVPTVTCERFSEVWVCSVTQVLEFVLLMCECFVPFFRIIPPCDPTADDRLYHICITAISVSPLSCWINVTHYNVLSFTVICSLGVWYHTMLSGICNVVYARFGCQSQSFSILVVFCLLLAGYLKKLQTGLNKIWWNVGPWFKEQMMGF